jgi:hypothetical protein
VAGAGAAACGGEAGALSAGDVVVLGGGTAVVVCGALCVVVALWELAAPWNRARWPREWRRACRAADVRVVEPRGDGADGEGTLALRACPGKARAAVVTNKRVSTTVIAASVRLIRRRRRSPALRSLPRSA